MKDRGRAMLSLGLMAFSAWIVTLALKWPLRTAIFPILVGTPVFFMATVEFYISLRGKKSGAKEGETDSEEYFKVEGEGSRAGSRRLFWAFMWIIGLLLLILVFGFPVAVPLFILLHLKIHGREGWAISVGLAIAAWVFFYGLFVWLLRIPFLEGWFQEGLRRALGIG